MMGHSLYSISIARKYFDGYLSEDELQVRQYKGRFWDINSEFKARFFTLHVLLDNDTTLCVFAYLNGDVKEYVRDRSFVEVTLPDTLIGRYYTN